MTSVGVNIKKGSLTQLANVTPVTKANVFSSALPAAEASLITSVTATDEGFFRISVSISVVGTLRGVITRGTDTIVTDLNGALPLVASTLYTWDIPVSKNDVFNLRYSATSGTLQKCDVWFVPGV